MPLQGAAAGCCLRVLLSEWPVRSGAGMLPLQGAAGAAVRVVCGALAGMLVPLQGEGAACQAGVCAFERGMLVPLAGCRLLSE